MSTKIEWTDETWNPVRGCSRVSEGCRNCYAEHQAIRMAGPGRPYAGLVAITNGHPQWTGQISLAEAKLDEPLRWREPRRVFVNSMSDLFHPEVPTEYIDRIFAVMALAKEHTFQILTKRPANMLAYMNQLDQMEVPVSLAITRTPWYDSPQASPCAVGTIEDRIAAGPLPNVWLGVSVEDQATADERIPLLLQAPAAVRWVSYEPALGPVDFQEHDQPEIDVNWLRGFDGCEPAIPGLDWVVCGGESGPGARPMHPAWAQSVRDQCQAAGVPFFFKQWGAWLPIATPRLAAATGSTQLIHPDGSVKTADWNDVMAARGDVWAVERVGKRAAGRQLDGREWNEYPGATSAGF